MMFFSLKAIDVATTISWSYKQGKHATLLLIIWILYLICDRLVEIKLLCRV
jgi:hypothetical protein